MSPERPVGSSAPDADHAAAPLVRFVVAGVINTGLSLAVYWALLLVLPYSVAYTLGYLAGMVSSFVLNTVYVFRVPWSWRKLLAFPGVQAANYVVGLAALWLLVRVGVDERVAPLISIPATIPVNFLFTRWLMQGRRAQSDPSGHKDAVE